MDNHNPAQKQLELNSLIEFSQLITSKLDLKYILNNILLSIMGKMLISKGIILLNSESGGENIFTIEAAKGIDTKLINTLVEAEFPKMPVFNFDDIDNKSEFINISGLNYFFKIYFQNKFLGLLCLGKKLNNTELAKNEIIFIDQAAKFPLRARQRIQFKFHKQGKHHKAAGIYTAWKFRH